MKKPALGYCAFYMVINSIFGQAFGHPYVCALLSLQHFIERENPSSLHVKPWCQCFVFIFFQLLSLSSSLLSSSTVGVSACQNASQKAYLQLCDGGCCSVCLTPHIFHLFLYYFIPCTMIFLSICCRWCFGRPQLRRSKDLACQSTPFIGISQDILSSPLFYGCQVQR